MCLLRALNVPGIRVLDGRVTDSLEGEALQFKTNYIDIFSASWGPNDDGKTMEAPHHYAAAALQNGVKYVSHFCLVVKSIICCTSLNYFLIGV